MSELLCKQLCSERVIGPKQVAPLSAQVHSPCILYILRKFIIKVTVHFFLGTQRSQLLGSCGAWACSACIAFLPPFTLLKREKRGEKEG